MQRLSAAEVEKHLAENGGTVLLDVREPWEFDIACIQGAVNLPMNTVPEAVENGELLPDDRDIVVICHHGVRSLQVAHYLEHVGFSRITNLDGGMEAWSRTVDASVPRY